MLTALDQDQRVISLTDGCLPSRKLAFTCPACGAAVRLKKGRIIRPHFAHISLSHCQYLTENESNEHLRLKAGLYRSLSRSETAEVEAYLPDLNQIADILVNKRLALEIQCSQLPIKRLEQRSRAYQANGYQVRWLLGKRLWLQKRLTGLQRQCLYFSWQLGFHLWELDVEHHLIRLKYMIHEDLFGKASYLVKTCSLDDDLLGFLRLPYQAKGLSAYQLQMDKHLLRRIQKALLVKDSKWLKKQEEAYLAGDNLLDRPLEAYYPQVKPIACPAGFCQIQEDLSHYYDCFEKYYAKAANKEVQKLFSPAYYVKMINNRNLGGPYDR